MNPLILQLRKVILGLDGGLSDGQLLERFVAERDEAAFAALVRRHGPMVQRVCRHVVGDEHDAEDAFQATFLVLARKAGSIVPREAVANWLCGVAFRTGQAGRAARLRRRAREQQVVELPHPAVRPPADPDFVPLLDRELNRLPEKFRLPIILCGLEGRGRKEVAAQLALPEGTLASRLDTARRLLAKRLARYGVAISAAAAVLALPKDGLAATPPELVAAAVRAGLTKAPAAVAALAGGALRAAPWLRVKVAAALLTVAALGVGAGVAAWRTMPPAPVAQATAEVRSEAAPAEPPRDEKPEERPQEAPVAHREQTDADRLQGVWSVVLLERDGRPTPLSEEAGKHLVFVKDDKVMTHVLRAQEGRGYVTATVRLDTTTNPKTIEVLHGGGLLWEGIYRLDEDTMKLCVVPAGYRRPTMFATAADAPPVLVILKRDGGVVWDIEKWQRALAQKS
jgi:RNA polymerase sigma-70 factor (ECF subfamily)